MTKMAAFKAQAKNLRSSLEAQGFTLTLSQAQEAIAKQYGMANWDTLCGVVSKQEPGATRNPVLADLPGEPDKVSVEMGNHTFYYDVNHCDWELLELLHMPQALQRFLDDNESTYLEGLDSNVFELESSEGSLDFTARALMSGQYVELGGRQYWRLEDEVYLGFPSVASWEAPRDEARQPVLSVPEVVKTAKGVQLIVLPSMEGGTNYCYVLVPPQMKLPGLRAKLNEALLQLKERDRQLFSAGRESEEYTADDVKTVVEALGCTWVSKPEFLEQTWD